MTPDRGNRWLVIDPQLTMWQFSKRYNALEMPRTLTFTYQSTSFEAGLSKVERSKLYGSVDVVTRDAEGEICKLVSLARDGHTLIPYGGTAAAYLNTEGRWIQQSDRVPVDLEGGELAENPSSFDAPIKLEKTVPEETLLDYPIRMAYLIDPQQLPKALAGKLADGEVYHFEFSWRGGPFTDPAFLLTDEDGDLWMLVGSHSEIGFVGLEQAAVSVAVAEEDSEDDADEFDFDML